MTVPDPARFATPRATSAPPRRGRTDPPRPTPAGLIQGSGAAL